MKVKDKVFVVTGGGNGMGQELVLELLARGARVAAVDVNAEALGRTGGRAGNGNLSTHVVNITDRGAVAALPAQVAARHGAIDGLINNAGIIQPFSHVRELDYATIERVMNVNFYGTLNMTKEFLPQLLQRPEAQLANISSMGGFFPFPWQTVYGASKAAIKLLTEGLQSELADTPVRVAIVFPGAIGTDITGNSGVKLEIDAQTVGKQKFIKPLAPSRAARIIIDGIERDRGRIFVGTDARCMDLAYRMHPGAAARLILKVMRPLFGKQGR